MIEVSKKVARSFRKKRELILNSFHAGGTISAGIVEGFNNKLKLITRRSHGFPAQEANETALHHNLGAFPKPKPTHEFCWGGLFENRMTGVDSHITSGGIDAAQMMEAPLFGLLNARLDVLSGRGTIRSDFTWKALPLVLGPGVLSRICAFDVGGREKGVRHQKCKAPEGPFRILVSDPFFPTHVNSKNALAVKIPARMRLLFVVPHYCRPPDADSSSSVSKGRHGSTSGSPDSRIRALRRSIFSLQQTFGKPQGMIRHADRRTIPTNGSMLSDLHIVLVTTGPFHLVQQAGLPQDLVYQFSVDDDPTKLGFHAHRVLRDRWGNYDFFCYLEDDLAIDDPWFFEKLRWFNSHVGDDNVLLPNRFERSEQHAYKKCYLDGDLAHRATAAFQDITQNPELQSTVMGRPVRFNRPLNPHSGCFFLSASQMQRWIEKPYFESFDSSFIGPLESAATLGVMKTFRIYKPAPENASFLEIEHSDCRYIHLIRTPPPEGSPTQL